ncbi:MAG: MBL fold metallo-hydrolase [Wujia sp.]
MANLITITNVLGVCATNCYTVVNTQTREAIIVDPADRAEFLIQMWKEQKIHPVAVFLTHGHFDHIGALAQITKEFPELVVYAGEEEKDVLGNPAVNLSEMFGFSMSAQADVYVKEGSEIKILGSTCRCFHVPGHTKGGICYYFPEEKLLYTGDTLFHYSVGRSDFPTGDAMALEENIREKLLTLPEDVLVYPGHEDKTTIGKEKKGNPFFAR